MYQYTYVSENGTIWGLPLQNRKILTLTTGRAARDLGGGIVALPCRRAPFVAGDKVRITGTTNYSAFAYTLTEVKKTELRFAAGYVAETFDGSEPVVKLIDALTVSAGHMVKDSADNLYYAHNWSAVHSTYVTKIEADGTLVYDFLNTGGLWPIPYDSGGTCVGLAITPDDNYLYMYFDLPIGQHALEKWDLVTGDQVWTVWSGDAGGYDIALDAAGNCYACMLQTANMAKFAAADGGKTSLTDCKGVYAAAVDDGLGIVVAGGYMFAGSPIGLYNLAVRTLDDVAGDVIAVGGTYESAGIYYTYTIGTGCVQVHDGYIYVLIQKTANTSDIYKYQWDGSALIEIAHVAGPPYGCGFWFDLWDNLVIVNQDSLIGQTDVLYFFCDSDLTYLSKVNNLYSGMLATWSSSVGGSWAQGNAVFYPDEELASSRLLVMGRPRCSYPVEARHACHRRLWLNR